MSLLLCRSREALFALLPVGEDFLRSLFLFFGQDWENLFEPRAGEFDIRLDVSAAMAIAGLEDFGNDGLDLLDLFVRKIELTGEVPRHELLLLLVAPALAQGNDAHD